MEHVAFSKNKVLFTNKLDLNIRKKLIKCYIWSIVLYVAETWTLRKADQMYVRSFEMWCRRSWTDRVRNEVLHRLKKEEYSTNNKKQRVTELITSCIEPAF
jgi:hypothetical protein